MSVGQIELPPKLIPVFQGSARIRGAWGVRGSGKTRSFARMSAVEGYRYGTAGISGEPEGARPGCGWPPSVMGAADSFLQATKDNAITKASTTIKVFFIFIILLVNFYYGGEAGIRTLDKV